MNLMSYIGSSELVFANKPIMFQIFYCNQIPYLWLYVCKIATEIQLFSTNQVNLLSFRVFNKNFFFTPPQKKNFINTTDSIKLFKIVNLKICNQFVEV